MLHTLFALLLTCGSVAAEYGTPSLATLVERAACDYRIEAYQAFRDQRVVYLARAQLAEQLVAAWIAAGAPAGEGRQLLAWFHTSENVHRPGEHAVLLSKLQQVTEARAAAQREQLEQQAAAAQRRQQASGASDEVSGEQDSGKADSSEAAPEKAEAPRSEAAAERTKSLLQGSGILGGISRSILRATLSGGKQ